uniref:Deacetylase sirtuin-type domain-containing protein n=1 Tax=Trichuris muris TaxID=70415 RepID=A0A5S6R3D6_TRIMR
MQRAIAETAVVAKVLNVSALLRAFNQLDSSVSANIAPAFPGLIDELGGRLRCIERLLVLTGAGLSTDSGIPDYRSDKCGRLARSSLLPVQYADYMTNASIRRLHWAKSFVSWPQFSRCQPNQGHKVLSQWEFGDIVHWVVTQNVDNLHSKAGSVRHTELHGSAYRVNCVLCNRQWNREEFQFYMKKLNPCWSARALDIAPDGDVDLAPKVEETFNEPLCDKCGAIVKPDIVFFGESVPPDRAQFVDERLEEAGGLLVLGTSLHVLSSYRLVQRMHERGKPIFIVNIGKTRADSIASLKVEAKCSVVLSRL